MLRIYFGILAPVLVVGLALLLWLLVSNDPEGSVAGALFAGGTGVVMMGLILGRSPGDRWSGRRERTRASGRR
jgi:hypothetical protein